jgi:hypothetical protein
LGRKGFFLAGQIFPNEEDFMVKFIRAGLVVLSLVLADPAARADVWVEVGDAGQLPTTAQVTGTTPFAPLTAIFGTIDSAGPNGDVDLYQIRIVDPAGFSATTVNAFGTLTDTHLFLFDANGRGVYANDDASASTRRSTLPAGLAIGPQQPGLYYLGISAFDREPVSAGGLIFPDFPFTGVFGPTGPGGGSPLINWAGSGAFQGTYRIDLTGAVGAEIIPEPATLSLFGLGLAGALGRWRWRRRAS